MQPPSFSGTAVSIHSCPVWARNTCWAVSHAYIVFTLSPFGKEAPFLWQLSKLPESQRLLISSMDLRAQHLAGHKRTAVAWALLAVPSSGFSPGTEGPSGYLGDLRLVLSPYSSPSNGKRFFTDDCAGKNPGWFLHANLLFSLSSRLLWHNYLWYHRASLGTEREEGSSTVSEPALPEPGWFLRLSL